MKQIRSRNLNHMEDFKNALKNYRKRGRDNNE